MKKLALVRREAVALDPAIERDFAALNGYQARARQSAVVAACCMVMEGVELHRLHDIYGVQAGGDRRAGAPTGAFPQSAGMVTGWGEVVNTYGGYSEDTAARRMNLAQKAEGIVKLIDGFLAAGVPFSALPEADRLALAEAFQISLGSSMPKQLCFELGLGAKPQEPGGDRGGAGKKHRITAEEHAANCTAQIGRDAQYLRDCQAREIELKLCSLAALNELEEERLKLGRKIEEIRALRKVPTNNTNLTNRK